MILMSAMLAAGSPLPLLREREPPNELPNRVDCVVTEGWKPGEGPGFELPSRSMVFVFPSRFFGVGQKKVWMTITEDRGLSNFQEASLDLVDWQKWPAFKAIIHFDETWLNLDSDPSQSGKIKLTGFSIWNHASPSEWKGDCRFVPEVPKGGIQN